jgi:hypothetical protein
LSANALEGGTVLGASQASNFDWLGPFPDDGVDCVLRACGPFVTAAADTDGAGDHPVD